MFTYLPLNSRYRQHQNSILVYTLIYVYCAQYDIFLYTWNSPMTNIRHKCNMQLYGIPYPIVERSCDSNKAYYRLLLQLFILFHVVYVVYSIY